MATNKVNTVWKGGMLLESENPTGNKLFMNDGEPSEEKVYSPKALMLSSLAGCSGIDVAMLIKKMRVEVEDFNIDIEAELTEEHPKYYHKVAVNFHFYGKELNAEKLQKIVDLSVDKYCGVMAMFRKFADVMVNVYLHEK